VRDKIIEAYGESADDGILFADGLDDAIIGICPESLRVVYSRTAVINVLMDHMGVEEAIEYAEYNTFNAYVGEQTPIWVDDGIYD
jgi:hypothetical protein